MVKTLSGLTNLTVSDTLKVKKVSANDSLGTAGQVLTTNGTATYWDTPTAEAEVNTALQYVWTNTNIFNANVTVNAALIANGSSGTVGQVLHSNGTAIYWAIDDVNQNTTYDLLAVANTETNKGIIRLKDVNNSNDDVYVTGAGGVVVSSNASHILITGQSGDITGVSAGDGLTGTTTSGEALISVLANTGIFANATGTYVNAAYIATIASNTANYANASYTNTFTVGTATYFVSNGNVGIGTATPADKLYVSGTSYFAGRTTFLTQTWHNSSDGKNRFYYGENSRTYFGTNDGYEFRDSADVAIVHITNGGNLGVANTAPTHRLSVNGTSYFQANVTLNAALIANGGAGSAGQVLHSNGTATYWAGDDNTNTTYDLLAVANTEANKAIIRLQDSGNANDDVFIIGANGITTSSNSTAAYAYAVGSSTVTVNTSGIHVNPDLTIANLTTSYANVTNDLYVGRNVAIQGNLTIYGTTTSLQGNTITFSDNMLYLNQGILATITNVSGNGTRITFTANNNYQAGWDVVITGVDPSSYNGTYQNIFSANATHFEVSNTNTASYVSGGTARGKTDQNPDLGIAAGYNDGTYHHTGLFRDATDGYWKVFDGYLPEPDANINIDTSNNSFNIAGFWSGNTRVGNTTVYTSISNFGINFAASGYQVNPTGARFGFYNGGGTPQTYMQMPAGGEIVFWNSGTGEVMRIANNNNVGIGETNPQRKLTVRADSTASITAAAFYNADTTNNNGTVFSFRTDTTGTGAATFQELAAVAARYEIHDHATRSGSLDFFTVENGTGANRLRVAANGNIGISNTTPSAKLTVNGDILASGDIRSTSAGSNQGNFQASMSGSGAYLHMVRPGYQAWYLASPLNSSDFYISESSGTVADSKMYFKSGGNVGIGTTTPARKLDVYGSGQFSDASGIQTTIWSEATSGTGGVGTNNNYPFTILTNGSERVRITTAGYVGIGTSSPTDMLSVYNATTSIISVKGDSGTAFISARSSNDTTAPALNFRKYRGTTAAPLTTVTGDNLGNSNYLGYDGTALITAAQITALAETVAGTGNISGALTFLTRPAGTATATTERMRINSDGNVGIGTSSPAQKLHVYNNTSIVMARVEAVNAGSAYLNLKTDNRSYNIFTENSTSGLVFYDVSQGAERMRIDSTGRVGIATGATTLSASLTVGANYGGTVNPQSQILAQSATNTYLTLGAPNTSDSGILFADSDDNDVGVVGYNHATNAMTFVANAQERMRISSTGNVGIGTTNPYSILHINAGNPRFTAQSSFGTGGWQQDGDSGNALIVTDVGAITFKTGVTALGNWATTGTERMRISANGNVGIGTASPITNRGLTINGSSDYFGIELTKDGIQIARWLQESVTGGVYFDYGAASQANRFLVFRSSSTEVMRLTDAGNVGIGTTSPATLLHVRGGAGGINSIFDSNSSADTRFELRNNATRAGYIYWDANEVRYFADTSRNATFYANATERMRILSNGDIGIGQSTVTGVFGRTVSATGPNGATYRVAGATVSGYMYASDGLGYAGILTETNHPFIIGTNSTERMRIDTNGTVTLTGITDKKISFVRASANTFSIEHDTSRIYFYNATTANVVLSMTNDSRVGVGTGSPVTKFEVIGAGKFFSTDGRPLYLRGRSDGDNASILVYQTNANTDQAAIAAVSNSLRFFTANSSASLNEHVRITTDGNVGIGVTNPNYKLDVSGEIAIRGGESADDARMYFQASDNSNRFTIETDLDGTTTNDLLIFRSSSNDNTLVVKGNGRVGINTNNPQATLDVNGEIRALGISGYNLSNNAATIDTGLTPTDFTILEAFGSANPNSQGSADYRDPIHLYIYRGTGWNGSAVTEYVYAQSIAPPARSAFPSGGVSANENMSVVWVKAGVESDTCPLNDATYSLRIKISNYTTTSYFNLRIVRRF